MPVLVLLWLTHRASPHPAREASWWLAGLTVVLMAFGVGVDIVHEGIEEVTDNSVIDLMVTFVEAAGEVGAMSGCWPARCTSRTAPPDPETRRGRGGAALAAIRGRPEPCGLPWAHGVRRATLPARAPLEHRVRQGLSSPGAV